MAGIGRNPFQPGRGVLPPLIAGREPELARAERCLSHLTEGRSPARDLLFYGPRGNGKTTLLLEIERRARERGLRAESLPAAALTERAALVRLLQERAGVLESRRTGVPVAGFGAAATPGAPAEDPETLLAAWIGRDGSRPLVITLDEAQTLSPPVARTFFEAVQRAKSGPAPFLVLAAGTPDAPRRLLSAGTFNERGFDFVPVGRLRRPDTAAALAEPARESGRPMAADALALLAGHSQDYPFFVQLLGSAAWEAAVRADAGISLGAARQGSAECGLEFERFYERRYREARARRLAPVLKPLARLFAEHDGQLTDSQLEPLLRRFAGRDAVPFDEIELQEQLSDLGVVWSVRPAVWEMGIPSFADYLLQRG